MELGPLQVGVLAVAGMAVGLIVLARGLLSFSRMTRLADTSTSRIASLAIGEVQISGQVEAVGVTLISPLQSARCVYYRSSIAQTDGEGGDTTVFDEERSVGFRVRDASGVLRIFPRDARFDVPLAFDDSTGPFGESPPGLMIRAGSMYGAADESREEQVRALLTVRRPTSELDGSGGGARRYREARLEVGAHVTVLGQVLPFDQLPDPAGADRGGNSLAVVDDAEIAETLAAARAAGILKRTPAEAWGNAAIPGFGVGRPAATPVLDPDATQPQLAAPEAADRSQHLFDIGPHDLVLAAGPDAPLVVALGPPEQAAARHRDGFLAGLLGAVLAIGSAVVLALALGGGLG